MLFLGTNLIQFSGIITRSVSIFLEKTAMKFSTLFITGVPFLMLFCFVKYASSIFCYDCNSAFDPRCGPEFDPFSLGVVNCSLKDPLEHLNHSEATLCRSIKMEIYGNIRVVRQCGYLEDTENNATCRRVTGNGDVFVTYCACETDLCNAAVAHRGEEMALFTIIVFSVLRPY